MSTNSNKLIKLLNNESFLRWLKGDANEAEFAKWENWINEDEEHELLAEKARKFLHIPFNENKVHQEIINYELQKLNNSLDSIERKSSIPSFSLPVNTRKHKTSYKYIMAMAASIALLIGIIGMLHLFEPQNSKTQLAYTRTITVPYGKRDIVKLSDGSTIIVNAHSQLKLSDSNDKSHNVKIWLNGEAYFSIVHNKNRILKVHTPNGIVTDLGTQFDVTTRFDATRVILVKGRVTVQSNYKSRSYQLRPGQLIRLTASDKIIKIKNVDTKVYTSWVHYRLVFNNTPVKQVIRSIEEYYGVKIKLEAPKVLNQLISGKIKNTNLKTTLKGLAEILNVRLIHKQNLILMTNK